MGSSGKGKGYSEVESPPRVFIRIYENADTETRVSISESIDINN